LLGRYALLGGAALLFSALVMLATFRLTFGIWPELASILAYFQNPPGVVAANPFGPLGFVVVLTIASIRTLNKCGAEHEGMLYACTMAMVTAFSYYLSRSHDNNVLNLLPFILLVALCLLPKEGASSSRDGAFANGFGTMTVMSIVAFVAVFDFTAWTDRARDGKPIETGPDILLKQFSPPPSDPKPIISKDALELLDYARRNSTTAPLLFDRMGVMPRAGPGKAWTSVNNIANYSPLPQSLVSRYILQGAKAYNKSGWLIVEDGRYERWPEYFAVAYDVEPMVRKGRYVAYVLRPKLQTEP
jgi:hypothetical protein